jgi:fumarate hydratase subunit alpha
MARLDLVSELVSALRRAAIQLPSDVTRALAQAQANENTPRARAELGTMQSAVGVACADSVPLCQDTGVPAFFVQAGERSPHLSLLREAISEAVWRATREVPLRPNSVDPFSGRNPGDNSGLGLPRVDWELVAGDEIRIHVLLKGGGSENMSLLRMLTPGEGLAGVKRAVVDHVVACAGNPCPPTVIGVGIGGGAAVSLHLAERALLRRIGERHPEAQVARLEQELLTLVNGTGVGPMGLGGRTTALDVHVEVAFRHPASFPVGILLQCWAARRDSVLVRADGTIEAA